MSLQRNDGGCRGPPTFLRLLIVLLLVVQIVSGEENSTSGTTSSDVISTSTTVTTITPEVVTSEAVTTGVVTTTAKQIAQYCQDIPVVKNSIDVINDCEGADDIMSLANFQLDISNQDEDKINNFFKNCDNTLIGVDVSLQNDDKFQRLDFGKIKKISKSLTIKNNAKLTTITGHTKLKPSVISSTVVRGNRYLTKESIAYLEENANKNKDNDIQQEKECSQNTSNPYDFTHCERIYGDLELKDFVQSEKNLFILKAVSGCLTITNSMGPNSKDILQIDEFLQEFVKENQTAGCTEENLIKNYCIKEKTKRKIKSVVHGQMKFEDPLCQFVCTEKEVFEDEQGNCTTIEGPLSVTKEHTAEQRKLLEKVTQVNGPVSIEGTTATNFSFLTALVVINSSDSNVPALSIKNNEKSARFAVSFLKQVISNANPKFVFENNGFNCSREERMMLLSALNVPSVICGKEDEEKVKEKDKQKEGEVSTTTEKSNESGQKTGSKGESGKNDSKEDSAKSWKIAVPVCVVLLVILLVAVGCVVGWFVWRKKKKEKEKEEKEKERLKKLQKGKKVPQDDTVKVAILPKNAENAKIRKLTEHMGKIADTIFKFEYEGKIGLAAYIEWFDCGLKCYARKGEGSPTIEQNKKICKEEFKLYEKNRVRIGSNHKQILTRIMEKDHLSIHSESEKKTPENDFIHASNVDFERFGSKLKFIAAQAPCDGNYDWIDRFNAMLLEQKPELVIMIVSEECNGEHARRHGKKIDAAIEGASVFSTNFRKENVKVYWDHYYTHKYTQLVVDGWKNICPYEFDIFAHISDIYGHVKNVEKGPIVVACEDGASRSGLMILCLVAMDLFNKCPEKFEADFEEWFMHLRDQRWGAVQHPAQYGMLTNFVLQMSQTQSRDHTRIERLPEYNLDAKRRVHDAVDYMGMRENPRYPELAEQIAKAEKAIDDEKERKLEEYLLKKMKKKELKKA